MQQSRERSVMAEETPKVDLMYDGGTTGCGDLLIELSRVISPLAQGSIVELIALDPGAPEDIPAWCRLRGYPLLSRKDHHYVFQKA
jgi:tRNA 2-thiouridine synthesizing protein A